MEAPCNYPIPCLVLVQPRWKGKRRDMTENNRLRAKKGPAPPPPREFCRHILS